ncbi:MAG: hypothetical protein LBH25_11785 [Fibromonadaceae bacterium]|jgi:hypothetical protein|nr:hypothetical protein [Fibromonadaceae bacterium]
MRLLFLFLTTTVFAQALASEWVEESWRATRYPKSEWYTGFVTDIVKGQPDSKVYQAAEKKAQGKLSESIMVSVQSTSTAQTQSKQIQGNETISKDYRQEITSTSNAVLAKVETSSYFDKKDNRIYAFATVKKKDLADFYKSNINSLFAFADKEFAQAEQLAEQGKKKQALDKIHAIEDSLKAVGNWASLLQTVGGGNPYTEQEKALWQRAGNAKMQLQHGTAIYLDISSEDYGDLGWQLKAQMQEKGCNCSVAENEEEADYSVSVKARLGSCSEAGNGLVFCHATATAALNNLKLRKTVSISIPEAKGGWANNDKAKASAEAFKKLTNSLAEKINQSINQ